jgi:flagellin
LLSKEGTAMVNFNRNILGIGFSRQLNQLDQRLNRVFEQLSSGERITGFDVDAAGGAIATRLESAFRQLSAQTNMDQTQINRLQTEEAALGQITNDLQRVRELQVQAGSDILAPEDQQALQAEVNQRMENIQGIVNNTQFAGTGLIEPGTELAAALENGIDVTQDTSAVDAALEEVTAQRSDIGAEVNAIESRITNRQVGFENLLAGFSRINDMDIAAGVARQANVQILQQMSAQSMRSMFEFNRQNAMTLLNGI